MNNKNHKYESEIKNGKHNPEAGSERNNKNQPHGGQPHGGQKPQHPGMEDRKPRPSVEEYDVEIDEEEMDEEEENNNNGEHQSGSEHRNGR